MPTDQGRPTDGRGDSFAVLLRNPTYRWFFAGQGASLIGTWSQAAAARWIVYEQTGSERAVGIVDAVEVLPGVVVGLVAGALADRSSGRLTLAAMQVGQAVLALTLAGMVASGTISTWKMAMLLGLSQVFVTFEEPSRQVFQRRLVGREALGLAIALETSLFNASRVLGPAVAGACLALIGPASPFLLNGASFLVALAILAVIRTPRSDDDPQEPARESGLLQGFDHVRNDRRVLLIFLLLGFFGVAGMGYTALVPAYARKVLGTAEGGYSALLVGGGLGSTVGALIVARGITWRRRDLLIPSGIAVAGASLGLAAVLPGLLPGRLGLAAAVACLTANGLGTIVFYASAQALIQTAVPDEIRGRVVGLWMIAFSASTPIGSLLAGSAGAAVGVAPVMLASAAACLAAAIAATVSGSLRGD